MAITNTTTTTTTTTGTQTGTQMVVGTSTNTVTLGNFVTDVSIQPYIASRIISFYGYNLRPKQRVHIFFDSVLVDEFCRPGVKFPGGNYVTNITNTADYKVIEGQGAWGTEIYADLFGQVAGQFNIPAATFRTGERILEVADTTSLALGTDSITTRAAASFTASNLSVSKQTVTLTTVNPEISYIPLTNTFVKTTTNTQTIVIAPDFRAVYGFWKEPIAQALTINTPNKESGIFATSLELYFKQKSQSFTEINGVNTYPYGVTVYLCETDNGYPNGSKILPFGTTHLNWDQINTSSDATVPTKFTFEAPVYLQSNTLYAFVVKPDGNDPDYQVYSANLGNMDITTNQQVFQQPAVGTAFYGATDTQWSALQTEYIKFKLNRAAFSNSYANAIFTNSNTDFLSIYNLTYTSASAGILPGDYIFQSTNSVINSSGGSIDKSVYGVVEYYDDVNDIVYVANSSGGFANDSYVQIHRFANASVAVNPNNLTIIAHSNTGTIYNPKLNAFVPQFATLVPAGTTLDFNFRGVSNNGTQDSQFYPVNLGTEIEFLDKERVVFSKSLDGGTKSIRIRADMTTESEFLSPVIDTVRYQQLVIANLVDPVGFDYQEFFNNGGAKTKYVSQVITLADGQDAQDLQITLTGYRPISSDIQVWVKFKNGEDTESMSTKTWVPMINNGGNLFSDPSNPSDYKEFVFKTPEYYGLIQTLGTITATNTSTTITGSGTNFQTDLKVGWYINMLANSTFSETTRKVVAINAANELILDFPFNGNYTNKPYFIVSPPTVAWLSTNTATQITGIVTTSSNTNIVTGFSSAITSANVNTTTDAITLTDANTYYNVGDRVFYSVPFGNTAIGGLSGNNWFYVQASNTTAIKLSATKGGSAIDLTSSIIGGETHSINTTNFILELDAGSLIKVGDDSQRVIAVTNATSLIVEKPWATASNNVVAYNVTPSGVTYLNSEGTVYSTFKQFQIKVILQSNDSSKVPIIDDLRALALQL